MYLLGWKAVAKFLGVSVRTVKAWHYEKMNLPLEKMSSEQQGRIAVLSEILLEWQRQVAEKQKKIKKKNASRCLHDRFCNEIL